MEEKIKLTEDQAKRFIEEFKMGHIMGLECLQDIIENELKIKKHDLREDIYDIITFTIYLNTMNAHAEQFKGICMDNYNKINELYEIFKDKLFDQFDNDFDKYWD